MIKKLCKTQESLFTRAG